MLPEGKGTAGWRAVATIGVVAALLGCLVAIQVRSQAEVARSLSQQDNTSLAFLIDDLHRSNQSLTAEVQVLAARDQALRQGGQPSADAALQSEIDRLSVTEGLVPVQGPGITMTAQAPLSALDLQDAINNLRIGGAEAIAVNDRRVITGTVVAANGAEVEIDDVAVHSPWRIQAIGDPIRLDTAAEEMTSAMRANPRVTAAGYRSESQLTITAIIKQHPLVYSRS